MLMKNSFILLRFKTGPVCNSKKWNLITADRAKCRNVKSGSSSGECCFGDDQPESEWCICHCSVKWMSWNRTIKITVAAKMFVLICRTISDRHQVNGNSRLLTRSFFCWCNIFWHERGNVSRASDRPGFVRNRCECQLSSGRDRAEEFWVFTEKLIFMDHKSRAWRSCLKCRS